jgi:hypothetical protein
VEAAARLRARAAAEAAGCASRPRHASYAQRAGASAHGPRLGQTQHRSALQPPKTSARARTCAAGRPKRRPAARCRPAAVRRPAASGAASIGCCCLSVRRSVSRLHRQMRRQQPRPRVLYCQPRPGARERGVSARSGGAQRARKSTSARHGAARACAPRRCACAAPRRKRSATTRARACIPPARALERGSNCRRRRGAPHDRAPPRPLRPPGWRRALGVP